MVAVLEGSSARVIEVTDVVTFDDELSPLQVGVRLQLSPRVFLCYKIVVH